MSVDKKITKIKNKKQIFLSFVFFFVGILIMSFFLRNISSQEIGQFFLILKQKEGLIVFILTLLANLIGALKWQKILAIIGTKISFFLTFSLYQGTFGISYFSPFLFLPAQFLKADYLKKNYSVKIEKGVGSIFIDFISEWAVFIFFIICSFFIFLSQLFEFNFLFFVLILILTFFIFLFLYQFLKFKRKKEGQNYSEKNLKDKIFFNKIDNTFFSSFLANKKNFFQIFALSFLKALFFYLRTVILIKTITQNLNLTFSLGVLGLSFLSYLIPVPTGLGVLEGLQATFFYKANLQISQLLIFTTTIRASDFLLSLLGIVLLLKIFSSNWRFHKNQI